MLFIDSLYVPIVPLQNTTHRWLRVPGHEENITELQATVVALTSTVRALEARLGDLSHDTVHRSLNALGSRVDDAELAASALEDLVEESAANHTWVTTPRLGVNVSVVHAFFDPPIPRSLALDPLCTHPCAVCRAGSPFPTEGVLNGMAYVCSAITDRSTLKGVHDDDRRAPDLVRRTPRHAPGRGRFRLRWEPAAPSHG